MTNSGIGRENMLTPMVAGNKNLIESSGSCVKSLSLNLVLNWFYYWEPYVCLQGWSHFQALIRMDWRSIFRFQRTISANFHQLINSRYVCHLIGAIQLLT